MDRKKRQDEDIMHLEDEKWPLWSKKERQESMGNEAWSKIQLHENLELKNLMTLYTLTSRTNLEHFMESIVYILYIVLKLGKSEIQRSNSVQIGAEMKKL